MLCIIFNKYDALVKNWILHKLCKILIFPMDSFTKNFLHMNLNPTSQIAGLAMWQQPTCHSWFGNYQIWSSDLISWNLVVCLWLYPSLPSNFYDDTWNHNAVTSMLWIFPNECFKKIGLYDVIRDANIGHMWDAATSFTSFSSNLSNVIDNTSFLL